MKYFIKHYLLKFKLNFFFHFLKTLYYIIPFIKGLFYKIFNLPVKIFGLKIFFDDEIGNIELGRYSYGKYEKDEKNLLSKYIMGNEIILELGANVGVISNLINMKLSYRNNHVVLEPNTKLIQKLKLNRKINSSRFKIVEGIISKNKNVVFYLQKNNLSSSIKIKSENYFKPKCYDIQDIEKLYDLKFDTIVMDIEGAEIDFFKDYKLNNFKNIFVEFHPNKTSISEIKKSIKILINSGFELIEKSNDVEFWKKK